MICPTFNYALPLPIMAPRKLRRARHPLCRRRRSPARCRRPGGRLISNAESWLPGAKAKAPTLSRRLRDAGRIGRTGPTGVLRDHVGARIEFKFRPGEHTVEPESRQRRTGRADEHAFRGAAANDYAGDQRVAGGAGYGPRGEVQSTFALSPLRRGRRPRRGLPRGHRSRSSTMAV